MFRYRYIKCIPDDCVKHETNSRILHVFLISVTYIYIYKRNLFIIISFKLRRDLDSKIVKSRFFFISVHIHVKKELKMISIN